MDNMNLFSQTYDQIRQQALGGSTTYLQMLSQPMDFDFPVAPTGQMNPAAYQVVSGKPLWSPVGSFGVQDATFFDSYRDALALLTIAVSPAKQRQQQQAKDQQTKASNDVIAARTNMYQAYISEQQNGGPMFTAQFPDFMTWANTAPEAKAYQQAIVAAAAELQRATNFWSTVVADSMPDTFKDAMAAVSLPSGDPASSPAPRGWVKVPDAGGILRWQPGYVIGTTGQDWRAKLSSGSAGALDVTLKASDVTNTLNRSWAGGAAEYDTFFWGIGGSGGWSSMNLTQSDQSVVANIKAQSSTIVPVTPDVWYDGGLLQQAAAGGSVSIDPPYSATGPQALFGQRGIIGTRVEGLLVAYKPSFEVTMSSSTYEKYDEQFEASAGLRIGPFVFGGSGGHEDTYERSTKGGNTFVGESTSDDPLIIGVIVAFPGINQP